MSNRELSLANALAHGEEFGAVIYWRCENCGGQLFHMIRGEGTMCNHHEDVIVERSFYLKCARCGSEEGSRVLTIVPSWSAPNIDRDKLPVWKGDE